MLQVFDLCRKNRALAVLFRRGRTPPLPESLKLNLRARKRSLEDQEDLKWKLGLIEIQVIFTSWYDNGLILCSELLLAKLKCKLFTLYGGTCLGLLCCHNCSVVLAIFLRPSLGFSINCVMLSLKIVYISWP